MRSPRGPRQLSLFGVEATAPGPLDLEGLLAGGGQVARMGGTARVSVLVDARWRAAVLIEELAARGVAATCEPSSGPSSGPARGVAVSREPSSGSERSTVSREPSADPEWFAVRTAYSTALSRLGARWLRGTVKALPDDFVLNGAKLRLWFVAAGTSDGPQAYSLGLDPAGDEAEWGRTGAALASIGLPGTLIGPQAGGPVYRTVGRRRVARLGELVGEPPKHAPPGAWPP